METLEKKTKPTRTRKSTEKQPKLQDLFLRSDKEIDKKRLQLKVERSKLNVMASIQKTKEKIVDIEEAFETMLQDDEFDYKTFSDYEQELKAYREGLKEAENFLKTRF